MSFNTFIQACGGFLTGRYIGAGRDTSGPTSVTLLANDIENTIASLLHSQCHSPAKSSVTYPFTIPGVFRESASSALQMIR